MFSTQISITYKLAVRDGYVEVPDGLLYRYAVPVDNSHMIPLTKVLTLIPGSTVTRESNNPSRISDERWVELPAFDKAQNPSPTDWYATLRAAGKSATGYPMSPET